MLGHLLLPEIKEMIEARDFTGLRSAMEDLQAPDLAELIDDLPDEDEAIVFRILPRPVAAEVFEYLSLDAQEKLLKSLAQEQVAEILNAMAPDDRTALLEELPGEVTKRLLSLLTPQELTVAKQLLGYPEDSVGRIMTPDYLAIREDWTVQQVLDHVRKFGRDSETLNVLYVIDDRGRLVDDLRVREFLLSPLEKHVSDLMDRDFTALKAMDDQEIAVDAFKKYDRMALPVTDTGGSLVGIVTVDDVLDIAEEEATEDIQKIGGMQALEEPYMDVDFFQMVQKRAGWMVILFLGETLTILAMGGFMGELEKAIYLSMFVPLIISSGGNSGSQAATLVIRAMALGEVTLRDWWRVMRREILSGLSMGALLSIVGYILVCIRLSFIEEIAFVNVLLLGLTVALTLVGVVMWGTLTGSMLPFVLKSLGFDPAASSAPFVATLVDVVGILIYFGVSVLVLRGTLL